jgi:hypothetical protein
MISRRVVTGRTVGSALVIESRSTPAGGVVTVRTLPAVVVGRLIATVAGLAVSLASMAEGCAAPTGGVMAV